MSLINFLENKQDFLKKSELFELIELSDVYSKYSIKEKCDNRFPILENISKEPVLENAFYMGKASYLLDTVDFNQRNSLMFRVIRPLKIIIVDEDTIKKIIWNLCNEADLPIETIENAKIVKRLENYDVYVKAELEDIVIKETEDVVKDIIEDNFEQVFEDMKEILTNKFTTEELLEKKCLEKIKLHYIKDEEIKLNIYSITPRWMRDRLAKLPNAYLKDKYAHLNSCNLDKSSKDKQTFREVVKNIFFDILHGSDEYLKQDMLETFVEYYNCLQIMESIKEDLVNDYELNKIKKVLYSLKDAGDNVVVNGKKYKNETIHERSYSIGTCKNNIHAKNVKEIKFGKNVLFNEEDFKNEFYRKLSCI